MKIVFYTVRLDNNEKLKGTYIYLDVWTFFKRCILITYHLYAMKIY